MISIKKLLMTTSLNLVMVVSEEEVVEDVEVVVKVLQEEDKEEVVHDTTNHWTKMLCLNNMMTDTCHEEITWDMDLQWEATWMMISLYDQEIVKIKEEVHLQWCNAHTMMSNIAMAHQCMINMEDQIWDIELRIDIHMMVLIKDKEVSMDTITDIKIMAHHHNRDMKVEWVTEEVDQWEVAEIKVILDKKEKWEVHQEEVMMIKILLMIDHNVEEDTINQWDQGDNHLMETIKMIDKEVQMDQVKMEVSEEEVVEVVVEEKEVEVEEEKMKEDLNS